MCQVCCITHSASFCESSHVILIATLSEVKGLVPIISQDKGKLESKIHVDSQPILMPTV